MNAPHNYSLGYFLYILLFKALNSKIFLFQDAKSEYSAKFLKAKMVEAAST